MVCAMWLLKFPSVLTILIIVVLWSGPQHLQGVICQYQAPVFQELPKDNTLAKERDLVFLPCAASGTPQPRVVAWLKNEAPVRLNTGLYDLLPDGRLQMRQVTREMSGDYQCIARNLVGGVASEKRTFTVAYFELITQEDSLVTLEEGRSFSQPTKAVPCDPKPKWIWFKNNEPVVENARVKVSVDGDLVISNVIQSDAGRYRLVAENTFLQNAGVPKSQQGVRQVDLSIIGRYVPLEPEIAFSSRPIMAAEGYTTEIVVECFISGRDVSQTVITWRRNGFDIPRSSQYERRDNGQRLVIKDPKHIFDHGNYQCVASQGLAFNVVANIKIDVFARPTFDVRPADFTKAFSGNSTSLNCTANGPPSFTRQWYRNGYPLVADENHIIQINNSLLLRNLNWEDHGIFQCVASNFKVMSFAVAQVEVNNLTARILNEFNDVYIGVGVTGLVPCVVVGAPTPRVSWTVNGTDMPRNPRYNLLANGSLEIQNAIFDDNGVYTCSVDNVIGFDVRSCRVVIVIPTRIVKGPEATTNARKGDILTLPCQVEFDVLANYTREWRRNGLPVNDMRYVVQPDGSLQILYAQNLDTGADFSCHIFSKGGNVTVSTSLIIVELPLEPSSPRFSQIQAYSMLLTWDAPGFDGGSPLTGYELYMKNFTNTVFEIIKLVQANQVSYLVTNLMAGAKYKFRIAATNSIGRGRMSSESDWVQTTTLAPSAAPLNFRVLGVRPESITFEWAIPAPETHNGDLTGFTIGYRLDGSTNQGFTQIDVIGGTTVSHSIFGLPLFTRYEVRIAARNSAGLSPWTPTMAVETQQGIPSAPPINLTVSVINATAVRVNFVSPPQQFWNGKLTKIIARVWPPGKPQSQQEYITDYDSSSHTRQSFVHPRLSPFTEYTLSVAVATTGGASPGSDSVQFKTQEGIPDAVRDLQVSGIYSDAFSMHWTNPERVVGILQGYRIRYRKFGLGAPWIEFSEDAVVNGAVVKNLEPRTRYEVEVAAFTSAGQGTYVGASVTTIESPTLPSAPSNLKAYGIWGQNISLGWIPGDSGRAVISHYQIEYNNDTKYHFDVPNARWWRVIRNLTRILENPANISGLVPSTTYRFRMRAYNQIGFSPYSNISEDITTSEGIPSEAPGFVSASGNERQALLLQWTPPPKAAWNSGSVKYMFNVSAVGKRWEDQLPVITHADTLAISYVVRGLDKWTLYNITMRLFNDQGFGPWSEPIYARTSEDVPDDGPSNIQTRVLSSSEIYVSWGEVRSSSRNGILLGYKVWYAIRGEPLSELQLEVPGNLSREATITELAGFTDYDVGVLAYTKIGDGFRGSPILAKTWEGVPGKPRDITFTEVTLDAVRVQWNPPARPNGNIIQYEVQYRRNASDEAWRSPLRSIDPFNRDVYVDRLLGSTYYVFQIRAKTVRGWGEAAVVYVLTTLTRDEPESPVLLAIPSSNVRTRSVIVSWLPRFDGYSPIRYYNLQFNRAGTGWQDYLHGTPPFANIPADVQEIEVLRLIPDTKYTFQVRANNDKGPSLWSEESSSVTTNKLGIPGAPSDVYVKSKQANSLLIAWKAPTWGALSGDLRGYQIKFKLVGGIEDFTVRSITSISTEYRIENLMIFTAYEVLIGAFNDRGEDFWTPSYTWRTGEASPLAAPTNVNVVIQGPSSVRVTWTPPNTATVQGYPLGYKIESVRLLPRRDSRRRRRRDVQLWTLNPNYCPFIPDVQNHLAGPKSTDVTLRNLLKYTRYSISVRVYNSFGDGPKSRSFEFTTPKDVPGPPYIVHERSYSDILDVDFLPPCEPNGVILGYKVECKEKVSSASCGVRELPSSQRRLRVDGLREGTGYIVSLSAKTDVGYGKVASIDFYTKGGPGFPGAPGAPMMLDNRNLVLKFQWQEGDNGNAPIAKFDIEYKRGSGGWEPFRTITSDSVAFNDSFVVYAIYSGLSTGISYRFRIRSHTKMGISEFGPQSEPMEIVGVARSTPFYKEIWFIMLMAVIAALLLICCVTVICLRRRKKKGSYKKPSEVASRQPGISSFEMAMVRQQQEEQRLLPGANEGRSMNGSLAPSQSSHKKKHSSISSLTKSYVSDNEADKSADSDDEGRGKKPAPKAEGNIANHYSNDPFHRGWNESLAKSAKKEMIEAMERRQASQGSMDGLGEKKRAGSSEVLDKPRLRPGRPDMTERKKIARSDPFLEQGKAEQEMRTPTKNTPRRPGKKPIDHELARSEPDLHKSPSQGLNGEPRRQSSFLRATAGSDSESESLQDAFEKHRAKRELGEDVGDDFYANPPPPYEYDDSAGYESSRAPPAYSPPVSGYRGSNNGSDYDQARVNGKQPVNRNASRYSSSDSDRGRAVNPPMPRFAPRRGDGVVEEVDGGYESTTLV